MKSLRCFLRTWALLLLFLATWVMLTAGCATTDSENATERPWNTPMGWENGLPAGMYDQQH